MAIGERISFFRNMRGMTQKYLGMQVGFPEKSAGGKIINRAAVGRHRLDAKLFFDALGK